jgi:hypothetical protein
MTSAQLAERLASAVRAGAEIDWQAIIGELSRAMSSSE